MQRQGSSTDPQREQAAFFGGLVFKLGQSYPYTVATNLEQSDCTLDQFVFPNELSVAHIERARVNYEQTVSSRGRELLVWINHNGPVPVRRLIQEGHFNYYTYKPDLGRLVALNLLRRDEKPRAKPGNPVYYHLTSAGAQVVIERWNTMSILERSAATCRDNYQDLGIVNDLLSTVSHLVEPGRLKSYLWLTLLITGGVLLGFGNIIGLVLLGIDAVLYYDDYVRKPSTKRRTIPLLSNTTMIAEI